MFKIDNKDTRAAPLTSLLLTLTELTPFFSGSNVYFEQVNICWVGKKDMIKISNNNTRLLFSCANSKLTTKITTTASFKVAVVALPITLNTVSLIFSLLTH